MDSQSCCSGLFMSLQVWKDKFVWTIICMHQLHVTGEISRNSICILDEYFKNLEKKKKLAI